MTSVAEHIDHVIIATSAEEREAFMFRPAARGAGAFGGNTSCLSFFMKSRLNTFTVVYKVSRTREKMGQENQLPAESLTVQGWGEVCFKRGAK